MISLLRINILNLLVILASASLQGCKGNGSFIINSPDTTSHNFTWQIWTFGEKSSSVLQDVAIIDENNIWAVGSIYPDSAKPDQIYNTIYWDGLKWQFKSIQFYDFCNQTTTFPYPAKAILAFNINDIWISSSSQITNFNGLEQIKLECISVSVNKIWGTRRDNIYTVGAIGAISHYNGINWMDIESDTELHVQDIWGGWNKNIKQWEILAIASNKYQNIGKKVLKIDGSAAFDLVNTGLSWSISSVYFIPGLKYYIVGDGVFEKSDLSDSTSWELWPSGKMTNFYSQSIRGAGANDIIIAGDCGEIVHFNGRTWMNYISQTGFASGYYLSVDIKGNTAVAVGQCGNQAIIAMGRR